MSDDQNAVIAILNNLQRDTSQIKTDLAVNTTKTGYIEEHLRTLNGKVVKQEEKQQKADEERGKLSMTVKDLVSSKRRWNEGWQGLLKQLGLFALGIVSAYIIYKITNPHL
jgi:hypothetical protein